MQGYDAPPNLPKDPLLATKWGFCRRDKGVRFKKVHLFRVLHPPPKSILATGLEKPFLFRQSRGGGALRCYGVHMNITRKTDH